MGGTVIETESEKLIRQGMQQGIQQGIQMLIEMGQEFGQDDAAIMGRLQDKAGMTPEQAAACLEKYGRKPA